MSLSFREMTGKSLFQFCLESFFEIPQEIKLDIIYCQRALKARMKVHQMVLDVFQQQPDADPEQKNRILKELESEIYKINADQSFLLLRIRRLVDEFLKMLNDYRILTDIHATNAFLSKELVPLTSNNDLIIVPITVPIRDSEEKLIEKYFEVQKDTKEAEGVEVKDLDADDVPSTSYNAMQKMSGGMLGAQTSLVKPINQRMTYDMMSCDVKPNIDRPIKTLGDLYHKKKEEKFFNQKLVQDITSVEVKPKILQQTRTFYQPEKEEKEKYIDLPVSKNVTKSRMKLTQALKRAKAARGPTNIAVPIPPPPPPPRASSYEGITDVVKKTSLPKTKGTRGGIAAAAAASLTASTSGSQKSPIRSSDSEEKLIEKYFEVQKDTKEAEGVEILDLDVDDVPSTSCMEPHTSQSRNKDYFNGDVPAGTPYLALSMQKMSGGMLGAQTSLVKPINQRMTYDMMSCDVTPNIDRPIKTLGDLYHKQKEEKFFNQKLVQDITSVEVKPKILQQTRTFYQPEKEEKEKYIDLPVSKNVTKSRMKLTQALKRAKAARGPTNIAVPIPPPPPPPRASSYEGITDVVKKTSLPKTKGTRGGIAAAAAASLTASTSGSQKSPIRSSDSEEKLIEKYFEVQKDTKEAEGVEILDLDVDDVPSTSCMEPHTSQSRNKDYFNGDVPAGTPYLALSMQKMSGGMLGAQTSLVKPINQRMTYDMMSCDVTPNIDRPIKTLGDLYHKQKEEKFFNQKLVQDITSVEVKPKILQQTRTFYQPEKEEKEKYIDLPVSKNVTKSRMKLTQALKRAQAARGPTNIAVPIPPPPPPPRASSYERITDVVKKTSLPKTKGTRGSIAAAAAASLTASTSGSQKSPIRTSSYGKGTTERGRTPSHNDELKETRTKPEEYGQEIFLGIFELCTAETKAKMQLRRSKRRRRCVQDSNYHYGKIKHHPANVFNEPDVKKRRKDCLSSQKLKKTLPAKRIKRRSADNVSERNSVSTSRSSSSLPGEKRSCNECLKTGLKLKQCGDCKFFYHVRCHYEKNHLIAAKDAKKVLDELKKCPGCKRKYDKAIKEGFLHNQNLQRTAQDLELKYAKEKDRQEILERTSKSYKIQMHNIFEIVNSLKIDSPTT